MFYTNFLFVSRSVLFLDGDSDESDDDNGVMTSWRGDALLAICEGNPTVTGFPLH